MRLPCIRLARIRLGLTLVLLASLAFAAPAWAQSVDETHAQAPLAMEKLVIVSHDGKSHVFHVEMAETDAQQEVGLMFRPTVPPDGGMLFDWHTAKLSDMWMKNTVAPLDMVFINADGTIHAIAENTTPQSYAVIPSQGPVRATLELAAGTTAKFDIRVGDKVEQRIFGNAG